MGSKNGLFLTLIVGLFLQILAIGILFPLPLIVNLDAVYVIIYASFAQAVTGIAKDLVKISGKASTKLVKVLKGNVQDSMFKLVALLTGSKNAVKGFGFFLGSLLISTVGYYISLGILMFLILSVVPLAFYVDKGLGKSKPSTKKWELFKYDQKVTTLSLARFLLFGSRDCWFEIVLPIHLRLVFGWDYIFCGTIMATWVIMYGTVQAITPKLILTPLKTSAQNSNLGATVILAVVSLASAIFIELYRKQDTIQLSGFLAMIYIFGFVFAVCSSIHSFLIVDISSKDKIASTLGYYYMANAAGRMVGTLISGLTYFYWGIQGSLWTSFGMLGLTVIVTRRLDTILRA